MTKILLDKLVKKFGKVIAVNNITLEIKDGEFFTLLGPSGCGKTTTLRLVAGLEYPDQGRIYMDGQDVTDLPPKDRDVAMVFQNYALYPHMSVFDNIAFPLKIRKVPKQEIRRKVKEVAEMLQINELLDRKPRQLSGGQQQRVALARAIVREPKVFLLDEPLSNLDAKLRVYMRAELKALQKRLGVTTIYVTHDQVEAMTMADRIAVMNEGIVQQIGTPADIYHKPANTFVAGFIGSPPMNFIECSLLTEGDKAFLDAGAFRYELDKEWFNILQSKGTEFILGVRPEHIRVYLKEKPGTMPAEVYVVEPLGGETILNLMLGTQLIKVRYPGEINVSPKQKVYLEFIKEHVHIFESKSKLRAL